MRDFHLPGRSAVFATNGMVATSHPLAAATAIDILKAGGNAADAAIAAAVLLGICEPQMTGIGGDMFALIQKDPTLDVVALNGSGRAPLAANAAALRDAGHSTIPLRSVDTVTIPGAIDGFCTLAKDFGTLPLKDSLAPAIHYARAGVPVAPKVAFDWAQNTQALQTSAREKYLIAGAAPKLGQLFAAPGPSGGSRARGRRRPQMGFIQVLWPKICKPVCARREAVTLLRILPRPNPPTAHPCAPLTRVWRCSSILPMVKARRLC